MYILLLLILVCISFYIVWKTFFTNMRSRKGFQAINDVFEGVVKRHMLSISEVNRLGNRLIAIDRERAQLLLIIYKDGVIWEKCLTLNEIMFCQVLQTPNKGSDDIKKVSLELTFRNNHDTISFPFFDERIDDKRLLSHRVKKSRYWKRIIHFQLSVRQIHNSQRPERNQAIV